MSFSTSGARSLPMSAEAIEPKVHSAKPWIFILFNVFLNGWKKWLKRMYSELTTQPPKEFER